MINQEFFNKYGSLISASNKIYTTPPEDWIVRKIKELKQDIAESMFLSIFAEVIEMKDRVEKMNKLITVYSKAGKDLTFMARDNFVKRAFSSSQGELKSPMTEEERRYEKIYRKEIFPLYLAKYRDVHRIPVFNEDIRSKIQGFITGFEYK